MIIWMRALLKILLLLIVLALVVGGGAWWWAGRAVGPRIELRGPEKLIGQSSTVELMVEAPDKRLDGVDVTVTVEQGGKSFPVFTLSTPEPGAVRQESADRLYIMRPVGKKAVPELQAGRARITVRASRPVLYGLRRAESTVIRDVQVRLEPPRVAVLSTFHYVNHGGSEFVIYRAAPDDVQSGVRVGDKEYPGFPARGVGVTSDPSLRAAFFALLYDQDLETPIQVYARDPAGNEASARVESRVFPKPYAHSRIEIDEGFLQRVVPAIASAAPDAKIPTEDLLAGFLEINGALRRNNSEYIESLAKKTSPNLLFTDAFEQLGNSQVEARFADTRTYFYKGKEIDRQVHLGFDLAVTANVPVKAAQRGVVVHAGYLGIYGNCVVIDHGLGVQSLYGHLSSLDVNAGDMVTKGQTIGRSGMTGLASGDHLHFTMLVGGRPVTPVDWWSAQWMKDRVFRKIADVGGSAPSSD